MGRKRQSRGNCVQTKPYFSSSDCVSSSFGRLQGIAFFGGGECEYIHYVNSTSSAIHCFCCNLPINASDFARCSREREMRMGQYIRRTPTEEAKLFELWRPFVSGFRPSNCWCGTYVRTLAKAQAKNFKGYEKYDNLEL